MPPQVIARDHDFTSLVAGPLAIQAWHGETSTRGLDALERAHDLVSDAHPRMAFLVLVDEDAPPPSQPARARIAALMRRSPRTVAAALVFRGHGFKASVIRGVVTGLNLVAGYPFPYRTFADMRSAIAWLRTTIELPGDLEGGLFRLGCSTIAPPPAR